MQLSAINIKIQNHERISPEEGIFLLKNSELLDLGDLANTIRYRKNPKQQITFVIDTNPNYSNICNIDCIFCAFYRHAGEEGEYTYSVDHMIQKFKEAAANGVTTVLLQGGVNPALPFEYYVEMVERTVKEVPQVAPHFYSTSEIIGMANVSGLYDSSGTATIMGCRTTFASGRRSGDSLRSCEEENFSSQRNISRLAQRDARGASRSDTNRRQR